MTKSDETTESPRLTAQATENGTNPNRYESQAPTIYVFFLFFFSWHEFMPLFYVPSICDLL